MNEEALKAVIAAVQVLLSDMEYDISLTQDARQNAGDCYRSLEQDLIKCGFIKP